MYITNNPNYVLFYIVVILNIAEAIGVYSFTPHFWNLACVQVFWEE